MTGADRYTDALHALREYHTKTKPGYHDPRLLAEAQVEATLAQAAATALQAILPLVGGDADEVSEWARAVLPSLKTVPTRLAEAETEVDRLREMLVDVVTEFQAGPARRYAAEASEQTLNMWRKAAGLPELGGPVEATVYPEWWPPEPGEIVGEAIGDEGGYGDTWAVFADGRVANLADDLHQGGAAKMSADELAKRTGGQLVLVHRSHMRCPF